MTKEELEGHERCSAVSKTGIKENPNFIIAKCRKCGKSFLGENKNNSCDRCCSLWDFLECYPALERFLGLMKRRLRENEHKGGWQQSELDFLESQLGDHYLRLVYACFRKDDESLLVACADIANFCMMIADNTLRKRNGEADHD